jgi:hypothetical protein
MQWAPEQNWHLSKRHHQNRYPLSLRESDLPVNPSTVPRTRATNLEKHLPLLDDPKACQKYCWCRWYYSR